MPCPSGLTKETCRIMIAMLDVSFTATHMGGGGGGDLVVVDSLTGCSETTVGR